MLVAEFPMLLEETKFFFLFSEMQLFCSKSVGRVMSSLKTVNSEKVSIHESLEAIHEMSSRPKSELELELTIWKELN